MRSVTWLHFSDIHLCSPKSGWEYKRIIEKFKEDLQSLREEHGLIPDMIFFTGDAAFGQLGDGAGKPISEQFDESEEVFSAIRETYYPPIPKACFFIVPGNHDVNIAKVNENTDNGFGGSLKGLSHEEIKRTLENLMHENKIGWHDFSRRLEDFNRFLQAQGYIYDNFDKDRLIWSHTCVIKGVKVGIAGMNSAWSYNKKIPKLFMAGHYQAQSLLNNIGDAHIKVALMHHDTKGLIDAEATSFERELEENFDFFLHGHEHDAWVSEKADGHAKIASGALYDSSSKESGYNIVRLDLTTMTGKVWLRKYFPKGGGWGKEVVPNHAPDGIWSLKKLSDRVTVPAGSDTPEPAVDAVASAYTSAVPLASANSQEARGVFGRAGIISELSGLLRKKQVMALYGLSGIGKSVLVKEVHKASAYSGHEYVKFHVSPDTDLDSRKGTKRTCPPPRHAAAHKGRERGQRGTGSHSKAYAA